MTDALEARIRRIEDRFEIEELNANYCHAIDKRLPELFETLWLPDAVWEFPPPQGAYSGIERIMDCYREICVQSPRTHHATCDLVVLSLNDDEAVTRSDCIAQPGPPEGSLGPVMFADYQDRLRKVDGVWKFAHRALRIYGDVVLEMNEVLVND